ncbi:MAG: mannosyltransferase family protein [Anaerolineales bacterium]
MNGLQQSQRSILHWLNRPIVKRLGQVLLLAVAVRIILTLWMWGVRQVLGGPLSPDPLLRPYLGITPDPNPWLEPWQRWDTLHYQAIAERGYTSFSSALFTPPLYPLLMRFFAQFFNHDTLLAGLVISGVACVLCLITLERMARFELGQDREAMRAAVYLISFPTAFFLFAAYTESIFLLAAVASLLAARQRKWVWAGLWGAVAALTRAPGFLITLPLAYAAWEAWRRGDRNGVWAVIIPMAGAALFPVYVWFGLHQPPSAILNAVGRGGSLSIPGFNILEAVRRILVHQLPEENMIELAFTLACLPMAVLIWKNLPRIYGIYTMTYLLLFLARMGSPQPLVSMARYVLEIFPAFLLFARWGSRPWVNRVYLYISWVGLLFFSGQFALWGWVG